jgi:hypothetical protein
MAAIRLDPKDAHAYFYRAAAYRLLDTGCFPGLETHKEEADADCTEVNRLDPKLKKD